MTRKGQQSSRNNLQLLSWSYFNTANTAGYCINIRTPADDTQPTVLLKNSQVHSWSHLDRMQRITVNTVTWQVTAPPPGSPVQHFHNFTNRFSCVRWFTNSKEVFFSEYSTAFFAFPKKFFFSYLCKLVQPIRWRKRPSRKTSLEKVFLFWYIDGNISSTPLCRLSWPIANLLNLLIADLTATPWK